MEENTELTEEQIQAQNEIKGIFGEEEPKEDEVTLPSDGDKKFAGVYENVDELKKGIANLNSTLPDYVLAGMNDDALEQHYVELRKDYSGKPKDEETKVVPPVEEQKEEKPTDKISDGLWDTANREFSNEGKLTDDTISKLEASGIPKNIVDGYIDGLKAKADAFTNEVYKEAGGEEEFNAIKAWAEETYTQEQLDVITSGSNAEVLMKMKGIKAEFLSKNDMKPTDRIVGKSSSSAGSAYGSQEDYMMDVMDSRYNKDAKYTRAVKAKFSNSSFS